MIRLAEVDAAIDALDDDESPAGALADLLDHHGEWDRTHGPDRTAVLESSGAWWYVYRGTEPDRAVRCASYEEARALYVEVCEPVDYVSIASGTAGYPGGYDVEVLLVGPGEVLVSWTDVRDRDRVALTIAALEGRTIEGVAHEAAQICLDDWGVQWSDVEDSAYERLAERWDRVWEARS